MRISYISNITLSESSGGMSGINNALYHQIDKHYEVCDYSLINPKNDLVSKIISKLKRSIGLLGNYHFFSNRRLQTINKIFKTTKKNGDHYFFLGFTQWTAIKTELPYYCYNDACFATYVDIYNNRDEFSEKDLNRIFNKEKEWLSKAKLVFFNSDWAIEETKKAYKIKGANFVNVGVGGFIDIPKKDNYASGFNFLFISREFIPKGGLVLVKALAKVREVNPNVQLWVIGDAPPKEVQKQEGIVYKGFFNKSIAEEHNALIKIFEESFCLVHPTVKDISPLVIKELAYYGCPAIATNRFAIPEFVIPEKSGLLIENPEDVTEVATKMTYLIENQEAYKAMRRFTRKNAVENYTWDKVGERILKALS